MSPWTGTKTRISPSVFHCSHSSCSGGLEGALVLANSSKNSWRCRCFASIDCQIDLIAHLLNTNNGGVEDISRHSPCLRGRNERSLYYLIAELRINLALWVQHGRWNNLLWKLLFWKIQELLAQNTYIPSKHHLIFENEIAFDITLLST